MSLKRSATETLRAIEESADAEEAERILGLSDEELDRELAEEGFDPKAMRARGAELAAKFGIEVPAEARAEAAVPKVVRAVALAPPVDIARARWSRRGLWLAAAAIAAVAVLVALPALVRTIANREEIVPNRREPPAETNEMRATVIRRDAIAACGAEKWMECQRALDRAKELDPAGEEKVEVKKARRGIEDWLGPPRVPREFPDMK